MPHLKLTEYERRELLKLLWDYLIVDRTDPRRVYTGYGNKTREELLACIEAIMAEKYQP